MINHIILLTALLALNSGVSMLAQLDAEPTRAYAEGELLVKRDPPALARGSPSAHDRVGATVIRSFPRIGWELVRLPPNLTVSQGLARYRSLVGVLAVEPNA